jgi:hypothetical protein
MSRSAIATAWKELYQRFFDRTDGVGRQFELWGGDDGWKKFKKAVMCAVFGYSKAYAENEGAPSDVMMQAHLLEVRRTFVFVLTINLYLTRPPPD